VDGGGWWVDGFPTRCSGGSGRAGRAVVIACGRAREHVRWRGRALRGCLAPSLLERRVKPLHGCLHALRLSDQEIGALEERRSLARDVAAELAEVFSDLPQVGNALCECGLCLRHGEVCLLGACKLDQPAAGAGSRTPVPRPRARGQRRGTQCEICPSHDPVGALTPTRVSGH